jgi:HAD superfamily hydrolase (TIGR01509 family)
MARKACLFDLDGTIWDADEWYGALIAKGGDATAALRRIRSRRTPVATLLRQAALRGRFADLATARADGLVLFHEARETLEDLHADGVPLAAVTNLPRWMAEPMLDAAGLSLYLSVLVDHTATSRRKPHPDPILEALRRLGVTPTAAAWYVGDSANDCRAAKAAGISFAWASWGYDPGCPNGVDATLRTFRDLIALC